MSVFCLLMMLLVAGPSGAQHPWSRDMPPGRAPQGLWLGVLVEELPFGRLDGLELPYGVQVNRVFPGSPAQDGGLQAGDIILELAGRPVYSVARLRWLVSQATSSPEVEIKYYRDGETSSSRVDLRAPAPVPGKRPPGGGWSSASYLGVGLQALTPGLREAFSVPDDIGVLIAEVYPDSPAARAGLSAGDTIVRMDRRTITVIPDIHRVLDYFEPGERIEIELIRGGERRSMTVTLGERETPRVPGGGEGWPPSAGPTGPLFDPAWWEDVEQFLQRWKDYFERQRPGAPQGAL